MYIPVYFGDLKIAGLVDTGSSINVISKTLYNTISDKHKLSFEQLSDSEIRLANDGTIKVNGIAKIQVTINQNQEVMETYILTSTSHPLIIGTEYLREHNIVLDFSSFSCNQKSVPVKTKKRIDIEPNTEYLTFGKVPKHVTVGMQGVCSNSKYALNHGIMVSKSLDVVSVNHCVPIKLLNASKTRITIPKGKNIAEFSSLSDDYTYIPMSDKSDIPEVQNIQLKVPGSDSVIDMTNQDTLEPKSRILDNIKRDFDISDHLTDDQKSELADCLYENYDLFVTKDNPDLGYTTLVEHRIHLKPNAVGKQQKPYRLPPQKREILRQQLDNLLDQGVIAPVSEAEQLPITSPIVLVTKRNESSHNQTSSQSYRFCCDFRHLNSQTEDFRYSIPNLQELTESFSEIVPNYITSIDLSSGFFQMGISQDSSRYTAFNTAFGTYKFLRLPMGLKTAPSSFQLLMDKILHGLKFKTCLCYLDDVLILSETFSQHLADLKEIFQRFRQAGLKLGPKKCHFAAESCIFLGHDISKNGIKPPKDRIKALVEFPEPKNVKQLRRVIGLFNWFKKFIPNYSAIMNPLTKLLKKGQKFEWKQEQSTAFENLKYRLMNSEALSFPRFDLPFILAVDTSSLGIGYMLYQKDPSKEKPNIIRFGSKSLSRWQQSYGPTKLELLGMVTAILDCADYLRGTKFIVQCDHQALQPLFMKQFKGAIYERWLAILQQFTFDIQYKPAEEMKVADALSRCENPNNKGIESPAEDDPFFPPVTEELGEINLPGGIKFNELFESYDHESDIAVQAMDVTTTTQDDPYDADTDEPIATSVNKRKKKTDRKNDEQEEVLNNDKNIPVGINTSQIKKLQRSDDDLRKMIKYLEDNELPNSQKESRRILLESSDFVIVDEILYHQRKAKSERTQNMNKFQLVIPKVLIPQILKISHDSPLAGHRGIQNTLDSVKEQFYFPKMSKIVSEYVQSCHQCQSRKVSNLKTKSKIVALPIPHEPFKVWQMDLFGPLQPSNNANTYVFTAVDSFSNFLYAVPLRNSDALSVSQAIFNLFCTFGVCSTVVSDQGSEFIGKCTKEVCKMMNVEQEFTPSLVHHCLGRCERTHRTLAERLTPYVLDNKQWEEMLPGIVFSINCCVNPSSKYSAFEIVYGKRPSFPLSPNHIVDFKDIPNDAKAYVENLNSRISIIREQVKTNCLKAQEKMETIENIDAHELKLKVGDYVYLSRDPVGKGRKFQNTCDGPYVVTSPPSAHMVCLRDPSNKRTFRRPVHTNRLKRAYVREPTPAPYFNRNNMTETDISSEKSEHTPSSAEDTNDVTDQIIIVSESDQVQVDRDMNSKSTTEHVRSTRPKRQVQKPLRFRDENHVDPANVQHTDSDSNSNNQLKVKRILAKRKDGAHYRYLVQRIGEPAQNAVWLPLAELPLKAQNSLVTRPPPLIE